MGSSVRVMLGVCALLGACSAPGYRSPEDSEPMRLEIEDRNVASRVRIALASDPVTAPYEALRVRCDEGVVTIEGAVDRLRARLRAVELAEAVEGVVRVEDRITVSSE